MVYDGYVRYGDVELVNVERLTAYVDNGIVPTGLRVTPPETCDGLAEVLAGGAWEPYRTPIQDEPPWFDANDPDTYDFAGILPLELTGLDDTTRTVDMTPTVRDGALPGSARRSARTVGVTAVLVGRTTEGVQAGLSWLRTALHGSCEAAEADCGPAAMLEVFTACPGPIYPTPNLDSPPITDTQVDPNNPDAVPNSWVVTNGTFTAPAVGGTLLQPYARADTLDSVDGGPALITLLENGDYIDSGRASDFTPDTVDGGGASEVTDLVDGDYLPPALIDGGGAEPIPDLITGGGAGNPDTAYLAGETHGAIPGPATITWNMRATTISDNTLVQLVLIDSAGVAVEFGPKIYLTPDLDIYQWDLPFGIELDSWRAGIIVNDFVVVESVSIATYAYSTPIDCIEPYWRFLPGTVTTSGPNVVGTIDADSAVLLRVEWVWVVGSPYRYGVTRTVLADLSPAEDPELVLPGVTWEQEGVIPATPWNCLPPGPATTCAVDPGAPGFGTPPALPLIPATSVANITTQDVRSLWVCVGPEQTPANDGVFNISLTATGGPVVGARVRVWDNAEGDCTVPDDCLFAYEYLVDFIPEDGVFTIDGVRSQFTTLCDGGNVLADASGVVRGDFGGPTKEPVARCDRRYLIRVQWLDKYPRTTPEVYTAGDSEGDLTVAVAITPREG